MSVAVGDGSHSDHGPGLFEHAHGVKDVWVEFFFLLCCGKLLHNDLVSLEALEILDDTLVHRLGVARSVRR